MTPEQRSLWAEIQHGPIRPSGDQTVEQARNLTIAAFQAAYAFEGLGIPSEAEILREAGPDLR